jgi:ribonuclease P protein component
VGLPKVNRLKHWKDFRKVYQQGTRYSSPHLTLLALPDSRSQKQIEALEALELVKTRIGISIGQKVSKKAVIRNRIKRQIRAICSRLLPEIESGWQVIIVVRPSALECKYEHFLRELKQLLVKANIINGHKRRYVL